MGKQLTVKDKGAALPGVHFNHLQRKGELVSSATSAICSIGVWESDETD